MEGRYRGYYRDDFDWPWEYAKYAGCFNSIKAVKRQIQKQMSNAVVEYIIEDVLQENGLGGLEVVDKGYICSKAEWAI